MRGSELMIYRRGRPLPRGARITQDDLAARLGLDARTVRDVELDKLALDEGEALRWVEAVDALAAERQAASAAEAAAPVAA